MLRNYDLPRHERVGHIQSFAVKSYILEWTESDHRDRIPFPAAIRGICKDFEHLELWNCPHSALPGWIGACQKLKTLVLQSPLTTQLPPTMACLENLEMLTIDVSALLEFPPILLQLTNLNRLDVWKVTTPEFHFVDLHKLKKLESVRVCFVSSIVGLPKSIGSIAHLRTLCIEQCQSIEEFPAEIGQLRSLEELHVEGCNELSTLPPELGQLDSLVRLALRSCAKFLEFPAEIGKLKKLGSLTIMHCDALVSLPQEIAEISTLESCFFENHSITNIKAVVENLIQVRTLKIWCSQLTELPLEVGSLSKLETLDVNASNFTIGPTALPQLKRLELAAENILPRLPRLSEIRELCFHFCPPDPVIRFFQEQSFNSLECLEIHGTVLGNDIRIILSALPSSLRKLTIIGCEVSDWAVFKASSFPQDIELLDINIGDVLSGSRSLQLLDINIADVLSGSRSLHDEELPFLASLLQKHDRLRQIQAGYPHLEDNMPCDMEILLCLNACGRRLLREDDTNDACPLSLWSVLLAKVGKLVNAHNSRRYEPKPPVTCREMEASVIYQLLKGPALLCRSEMQNCPPNKQTTRK